MKRLRTTAIMPLVAALGLVLAGCSGSDGERSAEQLSSLFSGYSMDYEPAEGPAELASWSDLVVSGTIDEVIEGRAWGTSEDDPGLARTVSVVVDVDEVHAGALPPGAAGRVYVEIPAPGGTPADAFDDSAPKDETVLLYLVQFPDEIPDPILDPSAGRPSGQPLYQVTSPEGFLIEAGSSVVRVIGGETYDEVDLIDYVPASEKFPVDPEHEDEPEVPGGDS